MYSRANSSGEDGDMYSPRVCWRINNRLIEIECFEDARHFLLDP